MLYLEGFALQYSWSLNAQLISFIKNEILLNY